MKIVSVNVGLPREVVWRGRLVRTGIFKQPIAGPAQVGRLQIEGDGQADLSVHGGVDKAVYAYPAEHYPHWRGQYPESDLGFGAFGENLTTEGLAEAEVCIGDRLRVGSAELRVTQPREPCFKLGIRVGHPDVVKRLRASGRSGFYLAVTAEGEVAAGDEITRLEQDPRGLTVAEANRLAAADSASRDELAAAAAHPHLSAAWREQFERRLRRLGDAQ